MQLNLCLTCPTCGRPYPPKLKVTGFVRPQIVNIIAHRPDGVSLAAVAESVYSTRPDAPGSRKSVWLLIRLANRELRPQGYELVPLFRGPGARWILREIPKKEEKKPKKNSDNIVAMEQRENGND